MKILAAHLYPNRRAGNLSANEAETRLTAYALKDVRTPCAIVARAAQDMATLINTPCWLVPIPSSNGSLMANARLCAAIAQARPGAQMASVIRRLQPIPSQCERHKASLPPTTPEEHHLAAVKSKALGLRQVYFVDNVSTSGNTLLAANMALGHGAGLVYAIAHHPQHINQPTDQTELF